MSEVASPIASGSRPRDLSVFDTLSLPGPSDLLQAAGRDSDDEDEAILQAFESREKDYNELHDQIQASADLLTNLSSFLSTFQTDLSSVSGEIKDLQTRSKAIERRGGGRRTIEKPLRSLVESITFPPSLVSLLMDSPVSDAWMPAIEELERVLVDVERRKGRVKAAGDAERIGEGLRITATTKIRTHLLSLLTPLSQSISLNLPVLQTSILLKHRPLFAFLLKRAPSTAAEIRRSYVWRARGYHETGFRRYARAVGVVRARWTEAPELIGSVSSASTSATAGGASLSKSTSSTSSHPQPQQVRAASIPLGHDLESSLLASSTIDGEGVMLAFQADEKDFILPPEGLFRSLMLVLLDNASAEYTFLVRFFSRSNSSTTGNFNNHSSSSHLPLPSPGGGGGGGRMTRLMSESAASEWNGGGEGGGGGLERRESSMSGMGGRERRESSFGNGNGGGSVSGRTVGGGGLGGVAEKDEKTEMENLWHLVFDPALTYCQTLLTTLLSHPYPPSLPSLLSMIRLNEALLLELEARSTTPLESFVIAQKMALWPLFQKGMGANVESLKKMADVAGGGGGMLGGLGLGGGRVRDGGVELVANRFTSLFNSIVTLSSPTEESMLFGSLLRLRQEMARLITAQASKIKDPTQREAFTSTIYDGIIQRLRVAFGTTKTEEEILFWERARKSSR